MRRITRLRRGGELQDLIISENGREMPLLGAAGREREYSMLPPELRPPLYNGQGDSAASYKAGAELPVLLGGGLGYALESVLRRLEESGQTNLPLAVVDREADLLAASGLRQKYAQRENIFWVDAPTPEEALKQLGQWQLRHSLLPFRCLPHPFYLRLRRDYYHELRRALERSARLNFWERARYPKFQGAKPRLLLVTSGYFLMGEVEAACARLGLEYSLLNLPDAEVGAGEFMERLLNAVIRLKPDFALTINHLGVDHEGVLPELLGRIELPLASWFVDNPHLIIYRYNNMVSPWISLFSWDADNLDSLRALGFEEVHWLPLGTDASRFAPPGAGAPAAPAAWHSRVAFVGNSMLHKVDKRLRKADPPEDLLRSRRKVAAAFAQSRESSVKSFLEREYPKLFTSFLSLDSLERQLSYETMITWEATLLYRLACVKATLPFKPLIAGDAGWLKLLGRQKGWRYQAELNYYAELPRFYPCQDINFNCTSQQMKGAVNQRVFDVPAAGAFLLTDSRAQMERLFEPGREVICYASPREAGELIAYYLENPAERKKISAAARRRILAEHLYEHRLRDLTATMRRRYS